MSLNLPTGHELHVRLKASLLGVVGSFVLFAAYLAIPPLGIFSGLLAPFPVAYSRLLHGRSTALIVLFGTATMITGLFGLFAGCLYFGMCGMVGYLMPKLLLQGKGVARTLFWTTAANLLVFATGIIGYGAVSGVNLHQIVSAEMTSSLKQAVSLYESAGVKGEELELLKRSMQTAAELLKHLYPALVTTMLVIMAGCNLLLLKKATAKISTGITYGDFSSFKNPDLLVWVLIAAGFSMLLPVPYIENPALNVLLVVVLLYFFQGLAVVATLFNRTSISTFVRVVLYAMLIIQPYLVTLIAGIGLFDLWIDFRTPKTTQENL